MGVFCPLSSADASWRSLQKSGAVIARQFNPLNPRCCLVQFLELGPKVMGALMVNSYPKYVLEMGSMFFWSYAYPYTGKQAGYITFLRTEFSLLILMQR
jgi:hypothetical protein